MSKVEKLIQKILNGSSDNNISFTNAPKALEAFGFTLERIKGSHHIFRPTV